MKLLIKQGVIVNPDFKKRADILIENSQISRIEENISEQGADKIISAEGKFIFPGFIDLHTHLRTPGREDEEDLLSGSLSATKGGFTTLLSMPNTIPPIDNYEIALRIRKEAEKIGLVDIYPVGAITKNREGKEISEFGFLAEAGCLAVSDDGFPLKETSLLRRALEYAENFNLLVISHCEDLSLSGGGLIRESPLSAEWGIPSVPEISETVDLVRQIEVARYLNSRVHFAHISSKRSAELIKRAKEEGINITAETCPHYFTFSLKEIEESGFSPLYKVNPPLGREEDKLALKEALKEGVIDVIATDHAPHTYLEKEVDFKSAEFGMIGLEFALPLSLGLVREGFLSLEDLTCRLSYRPAQILNLKDRGYIKEGLRADLTIVDTEREQLITKENIFSKSKNTPLLGKVLKGEVVYTIYKGKIVYSSSR
ncbi:MAG: dihydroorotase [Candidatus Omnitrophota bacterium]|nr:MAG: dihydroorotase [Candidatus Omnitrophota bacterium]RKY44023.1 MAG: dihydroorotase [Candidatus Omnitrophota bacterium]